MQVPWKILRRRTRTKTKTKTKTVVLRVVLRLVVKPVVILRQAQDRTTVRSLATTPVLRMAEPSLVVTTPVLRMVEPSLVATTLVLTPALVTTPVILRQAQDRVTVAKTAVVVMTQSKRETFDPSVEK